MIKKVKSLGRHQGFIKYFKNTSWLMVERIVGMISGLFVGIWVARYLGPEQFGLISYAQSFIGLFIAISSLGLDSIIVKKLVKDKSKMNIYLGTSFILKLFGAFLMLIILTLVVDFTSNTQDTNFLIFIIAAGIIFKSFNVIDFYFQSKVLSRYVAFSNIITMLISSILKIILVLNEAPLVAFAWVLFFDNIFLSLGLVYFYLYNKLSFNVWKFNGSIAKSLLKDSWPLIFSAMMVSVYMQIDQVMIHEMLSSEEVGFYAAAVKLSSVWLFLPIIVSNSLFPAIINAKKRNLKLYYSRLENMYSFLVWSGILFAFIITIYAQDVVTLLYGTSFSSSADVLIIHVWSGIFISLLAASGKWFINENLTKHILGRNVLGLVINLGLNVYLIPEYGIQGAAYATLFSYFCAGYFYDILFDKTKISFISKTKSFNIYKIISRSN